MRGKGTIRNSTTPNNRKGFPVWWRRFYVMAVKELLQLARDAILLFFIVYAFTADVYNAGSGVTLQLSRAAMWVLDGDHSFASRELSHRFQPPYFDRKGEVSAREGIARLDRGEAMIVLDIPAQFQKSILEGKSADVQMQVDATNSVLGFLASSYAAQIVGQYSLEAGLKREGLSLGGMSQVPVIVDDHRVWFNPNQKDTWFMSVSELLNVITVFAILLPAAAMVREKERGTVEQLLVSPLSAFQVMAPKVFSMTAVVLAGTALSFVAILGPVFQVPIKGSLLLFFAVTTLYVVNIAGLGLFISTFTRNLAQAGMVVILILAPMIFLSGVWTPPEAMPRLLRYAMYISPLHYYIDTSYGILFKGAGFTLLWDSILGIVGLGIPVVVLGLWRFRRQFA